MKKDIKQNDNKLQVVDFSRLSFKTLLFGEYKYLLLLLFWPVFGAAFSALEVFRTEGYNVVYSPLDDLIPFCELFVIPYIFWFLYIIGMYVYCFFYETELFKKYSYYIMITYGVTLLIYLIYPTMQNLRPSPEDFARDNFLVEFTKGFYEFDTNTNVCPSLHVTGAVAVSCAAWNSKLFGNRGWKIAFSICTVLIVLSTVFLKQHSVVDIPPALLICALAYPFIYSDSFRAKLKKKFKKVK